ncbi:MAG: hypothetical protein MMC23_003439 [Stictis urceolatum]|nr:hypothetical protein [Stictis urceolata]
MFALSSVFRATLLCSFATFVLAQSSGEDGYVGYRLAQRGDPIDATYDTASTSANVSLTVPEPDVFLNASVHVGEIDILVQNLTAKINLDAQVLQLLQFNAGVDASIQKVSLLIQNVSARVTLEARLGNVVEMINSVLDSIDLNPVLATLGQDLGEIANSTTGLLDGGSSGGASSGGSNTTASIGKRAFELANNILYSVNDYSGNTHTNRVLAQDGNIVDHSLDNSGRAIDEKVVGNYKSDMRFNGHNETGEIGGRTVRELEYVYEPFPGLSAISMVFVDAGDQVVATRLMAEARGGGTSTVQGEE